MKIVLAVLSCASILAFAAAPRSSASAPRRLRGYVGTYTDAQSKGIYPIELDLATGALSLAGEPTPAVNPSFQVLHPNGRVLFSVIETGESRADKPGVVAAFAIDSATGRLALLNQQPSGGAAPCHISLDRTGAHVLVANYWGGSVSVLPVAADGRLGTATALIQHEGDNPTPRDPGPHGHSIDLDAAQRFAVVADLGLDMLFVYRFDPDRGTLVANVPRGLRLAPGAGPRHFAFHPDGRHGYVINELDSTVSALAYDPAKGVLSEIQTVSTLPGGFTGNNSTAEIVVRKDGRFLYGSNRGHDSIAIFAIDAATGKLTPVGHEPTLGKHPRHFAIDPTGAYLLAANRDSDSVTVFRVDAASGRLRPTGAPLRVPRPVCVTMVPPR